MNKDRFGKRIFSRALRAALVFSMLCFGGCLMSEEDEYHVKLNADGKSGVLVVVMRNIQSDQTDPRKQQEDFDELVRKWKSDEYLLEQTQSGVYVKERNLRVEKKALVWREVSIFSEFSRLFRKDIVNDTLRITLDNDQTLLATNGTVEKGKEKTVVSWPASLKDYTLRVKKNNFDPRSDFVSMFRKHTAGKNK